jgi:NUMOD3 motif
MAQTREGALKTSAKIAGISVEEYITRRAAGLKRCRKCKQWRETTLYCCDSTRSDKLSAICNICSRASKPHKSHKGRVSTFKGRKHTDSARQKMSARKKGRSSGRLGKKHSLEARKKMSETRRLRAKRGPDNPNYVKSFAEFPELRLEISNGITLCEKCHELTHRKPNSIRNEKKYNRKRQLGFDF